MAIAKLKPESQSPLVTTTPDTIQEPYKSTFTALVPESRIKSLLKYVEGYPWTVNYYGQVLNENNTLNHFDPGLSNMAQSYYEIKDAIIQVSSPLSSSYDQESGTVKASGSAIVPFGVKPNVGDVFIARVDNAEDAIFVINSVDRKTHRKDSLYEVNYELYAYVSDNLEFATTLEARVQDSYYFNKDSNYYNRDLLIKPSTKEAMDRLKEFGLEAKRYYLDTFIQKNTSSLNIPGVDSSIYDPLLANFVFKTMEIEHFPNGKFHQHTLSPVDLDRSSILDNMLNLTLPHPRQSESRYGFVSALSLPMRTRLGSLAFTGAQYVLYPIEPNRDHLSPERTLYPESYLGSVKTDRNYTDQRFPIQLTSNNSGVYSKDTLHELFVNDSYIVSEHFYAYLADQSKGDAISYIELLIYRFLSREAIAKEDLLVAVAQWKDWSLLHQVYLLPIMLAIIRLNVV